MKDKFINFPGRSARRKRENQRLKRVPCEISERWLQLPEQIDRHVDCDYMHIDVMTLGADEKERKLCEIIVDAKELQRAMRSLPVKDWTIEE